MLTKQIRPQTLIFEIDKELSFTVNAMNPTPRLLPLGRYPQVMTRPILSLNSTDVVERGPFSLSFARPPIEGLFLLSTPSSSDDQCLLGEIVGAPPRVFAPELGIGDSSSDIENGASSSERVSA